MEVVSALGRGSTFSFIVPLAISPQDTSANMVDDVLPIKINNGNPYPRRQSVRDSSYLSIEEKSLFTMRRPSLTRSSTKTLSSNDSCSSKASSSKRTALVADGELIWIYCNIPNYTSYFADVSSNRKLLCRLLHINGYRTEQATDGEEALRMVEASPSAYDIVFMDNTMPNMVCCFW